jgi:hypothetical protein
MTRRRTLLAAITAGAAGTAGCLGILGGGGTAETGEQQTIADGTGTPTANPTTDVSTQQTIEPATETDSGTDGGPETETETGTGTGTAEPQVNFNVLVDDLSECGRTCRTLSYTVQNRGGAAATDVGVEFSLRAGGETVYEGSQNLDDIDGGFQRQATTALTLDAAAVETIRANGGDVSLEITPSTGDGTSETFSFERTFQIATTTPTQTGPVQFNVIDGEITQCGRACRTLDYVVQNTGTERATGIVARIRVYTPDIDGEQVYNNEQEIGSLDPNSEVEATKDIDVGLVDGNTIRNNEGDIDIRINLSSDQGATAEFVFDRQLES